MKSFPRLVWLNGKQYRSSFGDRKNNPGRKEEYTEATKQQPVQKEEEQ